MSAATATLAVNTGPWVREWGKSVGYFTTVWKRQADGSWKWIYDGGDGLKTAARRRRRHQAELQAACPSRADALPPPLDRAGPADVNAAQRPSNDGTLTWGWTVDADGSRTFRRAALERPQLRARSSTRPCRAQ